MSKSMRSMDCAKENNESNDSGELSPDEEPVIKKSKGRACVFSSKWLGKGEFKDWICIDSESKHSTKCIWCIKLFRIASGGVRDVRSHAASSRHQSIMSARSSRGFTSFIAKVNPTATNHQKMVTECELKVAIFLARQNLLLSLMDEISDNVADWFLDSRII